ncbi:glycerol-3-phosphate acyltransferase ATS11, chloroplastic-like [Hevea brasiliensis]|uniref:glycerol-3-phosphate acyltransferase ATS11, chloroplastic-like n=1 Tax=Hevea brasiliensis TaxID=3981 RepID=UPI0025CC5947|nr:glycerol-3-phosphate acyltransferase ATS11, chloroplastic-like [Hevea brasiliensis]
MVQLVKEDKEANASASGEEEEKNKKKKEKSSLPRTFLNATTEEGLKLLGQYVVLISNHQTEAGPAIIALLLEKTKSYIAENLIYVAGDGVVTDPLC